MAYPNILARGQGFVVTNNHSGGLVFPRHPRGTIRQSAYGQGVRSNRYGFERDSVGGNRIPKCGIERRVILGRTVEVPVELVIGKVTAAGLAAVKAHKPAKVLNCRPGAVAKAAAKARREARRKSIAAYAEQAKALNAALKAAKAAYEAGLVKRMASMIAVERVALQQAVNSLVATFNGSGEGLVGGL